MRKNLNLNRSFVKMILFLLPFINLLVHNKYPKFSWDNLVNYLESVDDPFSGECCKYLENGERRCSLPCHRTNGPPSPNSSRNLDGIGTGYSKRKGGGGLIGQVLLNPLVGQVPGQQTVSLPGSRGPRRRSNHSSGGSSSGKHTPDFSGEVIREVPSNIRRLHGGERRMVFSGGTHSRHSSIGEDSLCSEVIHEYPDNENVHHHRRHVSDGSAQPSLPSRDPGGGAEKSGAIKNLAKKVEPVSYPGGVRVAHLHREHRFHAHDDIMPLVEDWYDSWNLLGQTPITDPGNVVRSFKIVSANHKIC